MSQPENMAEIGPEITPQIVKGLPEQTGVMPVEATRKPWYVAPEFNPARKGEYTKKVDSGYTLFIDPGTGKEVARVLGVAGGGDGDKKGENFSEFDQQIERESNPERAAKLLVDEIVKLRTTMSYTERYTLLDKKGRPYLAWLYEKLQAKVDLLSEGRQERFEWKIEKAYPEPVQAEPQPTRSLLETIVQAHAQRVREISVQLSQSTEGSSSEELDLTGVEEGKSVDDLFDEYRGTTVAERKLEVRKQLQVFFKEAKTRGLLEGVDEVLSSIYEDIQSRGIPRGQIRRLITQRIEEAEEAGELTFSGRGADQKALSLRDVLEPYIRIARESFELTLQGQQPDYNEWEWHPAESSPIQTDESTETFWQPSSYPDYYVVRAKNPAQFRIAMETFLDMIKNHSLGYSPDEIMANLLNFKKALGLAGTEQQIAQKLESEGPNKITPEFNEKLRQEFEALAFGWGADYNNETYKPDGWKKYMTAMALDEGPARLTRMIRSGEGQVAVYTYWFDNSEIMNIFTNPSGERGELDITAAHFVQDHIRETIIQKGIGVVLKDFDPRDVDLNLDRARRLNRALDYERIKAELKKLEQDRKGGKLMLTPSYEDVLMQDKETGKWVLRPGKTTVDLLNKQDQECYKSVSTAFSENLERIGLHMPNETFRLLYEGFDDGDAHIENYKRYQDLDERKLPDKLRRSVALGRIQTALAAGTKIEELSSQDQRLYKETLARATANFEVAFQLQGISGEKARRGRGFLYFERNEHIRNYYSLEERSEKIEWLLKRLKKGEKVEDFRPDNQEFYKKLTEQEKTRHYGLYGIDESRLAPEQKRSLRIGEILNKIREGKRIETFSPEDRAFYDSLSPKDKDVFVDNVPVYQAENFVQFAVNWTKIKYADDAEVWNDPEIYKDFFARPIKEGNIKSNKDPLANFKAQYRSARAKKARKEAIRELQRNGFEAGFYDYDYDENGKYIGQPNEMYFKRPFGGIDLRTGEFVKFKTGDLLGYDETGNEIKLNLDQQGRIVGLNYDQNKVAIIFDSKDKDKHKRIHNHLTEEARLEIDEKTKTLIEKAVATYQLAQSGDFRTRYTSHTYWAYQGENRHTLLTERIFEAARRIRSGISRPEDEDVLATQLLIVDPTLSRVRRFPKSKQEREITLVNAGVEESFQDRQETIRELHKAVLPKSGYRGRMHAGYDFEDWAGMMRFTMGFQELVASQPARFARRLGAEIANAPFGNDSMGALWGGHGVMGAMHALSDQIKRITHQGIVGQFGITKYIDMQDYAAELYNKLVGQVDPQTKKHIEGLYMKPTNNNELLHKFYGSEDKILNNPQEQVPFLYEFLKTFGRLEETVKIMRTMYSDIRNAGGSLDLRSIDVFLPDGSFNIAIEEDKDIANNTGTSRHEIKIFMNEFFKWLMSEEPGGGGDAYPEELPWNLLLKAKRVIATGKEGEAARKVSKFTFADWIFDKIGL